MEYTTTLSSSKSCDNSESTDPTSNSKWFVYYKHFEKLFYFILYFLFFSDYNDNLAP